MRQIHSTDTTPAKSELDFEIIEEIKPQFPSQEFTVCYLYTEMSVAVLACGQNKTLLDGFLFDSVTDVLCDLEVQTPLVRWG